MRVNTRPEVTISKLFSSPASSEEEIFSIAVTSIVPFSLPFSFT